MTTSPRRYMVVFLSTMLLFLGSVAALCYYADPLHLFHEGGERGAASVLLSGRNVGNCATLDERLLSKEVIEQRQGAPDVIAFGSSRAMRITRAFFPGQSFFNYAMSDASVEDYVALDEVMHRAGKRPKMIVLMLEPYQLNYMNDQSSGWKTLVEEFLAGAKRLGINPVLQKRAEMSEGPITVVPEVLNGLALKPSLALGRWRKLLSLTCLKRSIWKPEYGDECFFATDKLIEETPVKASDGSRRYAAVRMNMTPAEVHDMIVRNAAQRPVFGLSQFHELDRNIEAAIEALVTSWQREGIRVVIYVPPYHPLLYRMMSTEPEGPLVNEAQRYFVSLASRTGATLIGSVNPAEAGCGDTEFFDAIHPNDDCIEHIFSGITQRMKGPGGVEPPTNPL